MATIKIEAQVPTDELLQAVGRLPQSELEQFVYQVIVLQAQRQAPRLSQAESELLSKINQGIPSEIQKRYDELAAKRQDETLTSDEHDELLRLTARIEDLQARRIKCLAELARLRQTTLPALMQNLGIREPAYA